MKVFFSRSLLVGRDFRASEAALFAALVALIIGIPNSATAQTAGDIMCNAWVNIGPFAPLLSALTWTFGGILIGMGLLHLKNYHDSPHNHPVYQGVLKIGGGAALMTLPFFISAVTNSLFTLPGPGGALVCTPGAVVGGPLPDLVTMLTNLVSNIQAPLNALIEVTSYLMGGIFIAIGIVKASKFGTDPRGSSIPHILVYMVIGGLLMACGGSLGNMIGSLFGIGAVATIDMNWNAVNTVLNWNSVIALGGNAAFATAISAGLTFIQLVGGLAFIRGLYIVKNAVEGKGQATLPQGFTHLIGGAIAVNIFTFLEWMDNTFGTALL